MLLNLIPMLEALITSKTRIKLLLKFFLNSDNTAYLRSLESEFGESSNAIRVELNRFEDVGLLVSSTSKNKKLYQANKEHSLFKEIHNIIFKFVGIDEVIDKVINSVGDVEAAYVTGNYARGLDSGTMELLLVGADLNRDNLRRLVKRTEKIIKREIHLEVVESEQLDEFLGSNPALLIWKAEKTLTS